MILELLPGRVANMACSSIRKVGHPAQLIPLWQYPVAVKECTTAFPANDFRCFVRRLQLAINEVGQPRLSCV
jgi:hypothetical protein